MANSSADRPPFVALFFPPTVGYFADVITGVQRFAQTQGWILQVCPTLDVAMGVACDRTQPDGILINSGDWNCAALLEKVAGVPTVQVGGAILPGVPRVTTDNEAIGRLAAEHFTERGFTQFAFCGYESEDWSRDRESGFAAALRQAGFACGPRLTRNGSINAVSVTGAMREWAQSLLPGPVGVFACHDRAARLLAHACVYAKIRVPDDVAILGVDNDSHECAFASPSLSSIMGSARRVGYDGAVLLNTLMAGGAAPPASLSVPPGGVVVRQSTDVLALEDADIAAAVKFIRQHASKNVTVKTVVDATLISRRLLEKKFVAILGRTPREEILLAHLREAKKLLTSSSLEAAEIAFHSGFPSPSKFSAVFRRETGMSPTEFRRLYSVHV